MDSGNSGSLQSSSGGDDEYDPRNESISAFLNSAASGRILTTQRQDQSQLPLQSSPSHHYFHTTSSMFDRPFPNYFDVLSSSNQPNPNSPLNNGKVWSRNLRSDPNSTGVAALMGSSSSTQPVLQGAHHQVMTVASPSSTSDQPNQFRQSKKRSRASRRAPTTVLTTDTSNFRAMVQEFTGIPAPPFSAASPFSSSLLEPIRPSPYLLRPFAQKVQPPPPFSSAHFTSSDTCNSNSSNNFQLLSEQSPNLLNMQHNSVLTFQSLLQSTLPHKFSLPTSSGLAQNSQGVSSSPRMALVIPDGSDHAHGNQDHLRSFNSNPRRDNSCNNDKVSDQNVSSRGAGEGMVDSWINSSD